MYIRYFALTNNSNLLHDCELWCRFGKINRARLYVYHTLFIVAMTISWLTYIAIYFGLSNIALILTKRDRRNGVVLKNCELWWLQRVLWSRLEEFRRRLCHNFTSKKVADIPCICYLEPPKEKMYHILGNCYPKVYRYHVFDYSWLKLL